MKQFPPFEALHESPRPRRVIVIIMCVFLFRKAIVGAAVSDPVSYEAPTTSMNEEAIVAAEESTRGTARRGRAATVSCRRYHCVAATCKLRKLFYCGYCDAGDCGEFAYEDPMLEIE
ncbi:hypothetical protein BJY52DRAFT_1227479 [Lactarius psammicola]|nr:hypothetical protein BJY52DRAFT_1227479 [Lactarius psammicola]